MAPLEAKKQLLLKQELQIPRLLPRLRFVIHLVLVAHRVVQAAHRAALAVVVAQVAVVAHRLAVVVVPVVREALPLVARAVRHQVVKVAQVASVPLAAVAVPKVLVVAVEQEYPYHRNVWNNRKRAHLNSSIKHGRFYLFF